MSSLEIGALAGLSLQSFCSNKLAGWLGNSHTGSDVVIGGYRRGWLRQLGQVVVARHLEGSCRSRAVDRVDD